MTNSNIHTTVVKQVSKLKSKSARLTADDHYILDRLGNALDDEFFDYDQKHIDQALSVIVNNANATLQQMRQKYITNMARHNDQKYFGQLFDQVYKVCAEHAF